MSKRSIKAEIQQRQDAIIAFASKQNPVTVRGIYYHLTTLEVVPKTDAGYQKVAGDCKNLRLSGDIPFD